VRIGLDVSGAVGGASGVRRYVESLLRGFHEAGGDHEFFVYAAFWGDFPARGLSLAIPDSPRFHRVLKRVPQRLLLGAEARLGLRIQERWLAPYGLDLLHGFASILPPLRGLRSALTLYHIFGELDSSSAWNTFYFNERPRASALAADRLIACSEFTRQAAIRELGVDARKVDTVWLGGAGPEFRGAPDPGRLKALGVNGPYLLFVSAINNRKNLTRLVQAYARVRAKGRPQSLILVGRADASAASLKEEIARLGLAADVRFLESLGQEDLRALYHGADLFVYPSLLEGFALPVIEAMTCEVPVLVARASCLPEIAGDAAWYCDGEDVGDMAAQLEKVLGDADLRRQLVNKGRERARLFDWTTCARGTLASYRKALSPG
jgi:glycosyltransferase involved in cell wall biosynthesis